LKTAILVGLGVDRSKATQLLQRHGGSLRAAIKASKSGDG
jgi:N-acetylmuramic acid 6-phosphate (MurNAc-6-P) etherase